MKWYGWLSLALMAFPLLGGTPVVRINELDADQLNTDGAEFVELHGSSNGSLTGFVLVFFNGNGDTSYRAYDLDGQSLDADGFWVLCGDMAMVPNCDLDVSPNTNLLQNGADAVALYMGDAADFPSGTPVTSTNLVDAVVYDTDDNDDSGLLNTLTPEQPQINERASGDGNAHSNGRLPDGGDALVTRTYTQLLPTPGTSNQGVAPANPKINEFVANHAGSDTNEYLELYGTPNTDFSDLWFVQLEGDQDDNPGLIDSFHQVGTTNAAGFWRTAYLENVLGNGSKTILLVRNFSGSQGTDLDPEDDGTLNTTPWTEILDDVAVNQQNLGDQVYSGTVLLEGFDGSAFTPGGASRVPNGTDNEAIADWRRNAFNGTGIPGFPGFVGASDAANTPNDFNRTTQPEQPPFLMINEFVANLTGADTQEFIELFGNPLTDYPSVTLLTIDGSANPGQILQTFPVATTTIGGYASTGLLNEVLSDAALTIMIVDEFSGTIGTDLDTNDDGNLDIQPWLFVVDSVAVDDGVVGSHTYGNTVLAPNFDGGTTTVGGASRIPNGTDTNSVGDWRRNNMDGAGLPGRPTTLNPGEVFNTHLGFNTGLQAGGTTAIINEFVANHTGTDDTEYVEILADPNLNYDHLWVVQLDGNTSGNPGQVQAVIQVGDTNGDGYWVPPFLTNRLSNNSMTLLLVNEFSGSLPLDLDTDDDGTLDSTPWTSLLDDVAIRDNDAADIGYSTTVLAPNFDGGFFTAGGVSRIPDGTDTNAISDWKRNDFFGEGLPGFNGNLDPGEALNTPGLENSDELPPGTGAILSEFVANHIGTDTHEYVEIFGDPMLPYTTTFVLVLDSAAGGNPGLILNAIQGDFTDSDGFWSSPFQPNESISNDSISLLVVEEFTGAVGNDLDTNDDGTLDTLPWTNLNDSLAVNPTGAGGTFYSTVQLSNGTARGGNPLGGASRVPYGTDSDIAADWRTNDFDGAGLTGFNGTVETGEAYNTPAMVNLISTGEYYQAADTTDANSLRASLHDIIDDHVYIPYTSNFTDTWNVLEMADEDPGNTANIISIYKNATYTKEGGGNANYNREHSWPKSYGFPDDFDLAYPYTDFHHLRLADSDYNSLRSNRAYGTCNLGCGEAPTDMNNGIGGGTGIYPGNSNWHTGSGSNGIWEVWPTRRGDIARSLLYMDLRYEGGQHGVRNAPEPDLILTDDTSLINTTGFNTSSRAYMGRLAVLLQWHLEDPVDDEERLRNEVIYMFQGNRNPFVDQPQWVDCVYSGNCEPEISFCLLELFSDWRAGASPCAAPSVLSVLDYVNVLNDNCTCSP